MNKDYTITFQNQWEEQHAIKYIERTNEAWIALISKGKTKQVFMLPFDVLSQFVDEVRNGKLDEIVEKPKCTNCGKEIEPDDAYCSRSCLVEFLMKR